MGALIRGALVVASALAPLTPCAAWAQGLAVEFRSAAALGSTATDQHGAAFTIAGLSGVTYIGPATGTGLHRFLAVMDNSDKLVEIEAGFGPTGMLTSAAVVRGFSLGQTADFEDLAISPDGARLWLCDEGGPGVRAVAFPGLEQAETLSIPEVFGTRRANFGFEALAVSRDGREVWTANEEALAADGPLSTPGAGTVVRLLRLRDEGVGHVAAAQHAYACEAMHGAVVTGARSGLVALVVLPSGRVLALERSFAFNLGGFFRSRMFEIDAGAATDVSGVPSLDGAAYAPVAKALLWSGNLNNLEGLCLGPALDAGGLALVGVVDDGDPLSSNTLVSYRVTGPVEAPCAADADGNGSVEVADIFAFLARWFADDPRADFDGDGVRGVADVFAFLSAWFAGCP